MPWGKKKIPPEGTKLTVIKLLIKTVIKPVEGCYNKMFNSNLKMLIFQATVTKYISNLLEDCDYQQN